MITLQEGNKAPAFSGKNQQGKKISLSDYKGKKLILYFYPQAGTPTCTIQSCNLRDNFEALQDAGFSILGVSPDAAPALQKFADRHHLPFPLLADTHQNILKKYGVWDKKKMFGHEYMGVLRTTLSLMKKV